MGAPAVESPGEWGCGSRSGRKERTRRATLDAALRLAEGTRLVAISLRRVG